MRRRPSISLLAAVAIVVALTLAVEARSMQELRTTADGVFTEAQATRGEAAYMEHCARCHDGGSPAAPVLQGNAFMNQWRELPLANFFDDFRTRMPPGEAAGTLSEEIYLDLLVHILKTNALPMGVDELRVDALEDIQFTGPDGPQPLPNLTLLRVVGCLNSDPVTEWTLDNASDPVRIRSAFGEGSDEELIAAATEPLGTGTYRLQNFDLVSQGFSPEPFVGHKTQLKGVLIRQFDGEYLNVLSVESVATNCAP